MPRARRLIKSGHCYHICFRAKCSLPFVPYELTRFIIAATLARVQRDCKVVLCHDIWNGSHCHIIVVVKDAEMCTRFYGEVEKKITDIMKRLLGLPHLEIWEDRPICAEIADLEKAEAEIAYLYSNPAQDNLVESIEKFPGYSSWTNFQKCLSTLTAETKEQFPWIRLPSVPELPSPVLSHFQDKNLVKILTEENKATIHDLVRKPNEWMKCFGITDDATVLEINQGILRTIRDRAQQLAADRAILGKTVMGVAKLTGQPLMKPHTPRKHSRKVFVLCSIKELRIALIKSFKLFCEECRECYRRYREGDYSVTWPPGAFKPPLRPAANYLVFGNM